ncbi:MAG TPA: aldehyde dehydrogenase family protein, partial [Metabacillus sp.]|nr:aldehyde dehydrogenase family protein [Metabacillus sp.]
MVNHITEENNKETSLQVKDVDLYINGVFVKSESSTTFQNNSPFTNKVINQIAEGRKEDIKKAVTAAKDAFEQTWSKLKIAERMTYIN